MNRRGFIGSLAAIAGTLALDPEKLLWRPEAKTIFVPTPSSLAYGWVRVAGPAYAHFDAGDLATAVFDSEMRAMARIGDSMFMHVQTKGTIPQGLPVIWEDSKTVRLATDEECRDVSRLAGVGV